MNIINQDVGDVLILIPAKGASTRLPRKNLRKLGGIPLLKWAVDAARESNITEHIVVSTEDEEVWDFCISIGVDVCKRPRALAVDPAGVVDVALYVLDQLEKINKVFKTLIILLPTCPLRSSNDIKNAYNLFKNENGKFLMSVTAYPHTPFSAMGLSDNLHLNPFFTSYIGKKSQELPKAYRANGAIHVLDIQEFKRAKSYYEQPLIGYLMPQERSVDIDTQDDLDYAEYLLSKNRERTI